MPPTTRAAHPLGSTTSDGRAAAASGSGPRSARSRPAPPGTGPAGAGAAGPGIEKAHVRRGDPEPDRNAGPGAVAAALRGMLAAGELDLPLPGAGRTADRWAALARWGGRDLSLARLAEGHTDALAILAEADREPAPGALYGVWASRSGGAAVRVEPRAAADVLSGTLRFCSGARVIDRALVVADPPPGAPADRLLVDVDVRGAGVEPVAGTWCTAAMADADTLDVVFDGVPLDDDHAVGGPGWYVGRRGFVLGGGGVAAVWWGGAAGLLDRVLGHLRSAPDPHVLAHVGELHAALAAADALLHRTAALVDRTGSVAGAVRAGIAPVEVALAVATLRSAVERVVRDVVDRVPRVLGPGPLSWDAGLARALGDLALYVRQHHGERDHAVLGEQVVDRWRRA